MGIKIKVGWMKPCTLCEIGEYSIVRIHNAISSQEFFARACSALILNNIYLLYTLHHILWRVLFLVPHNELKQFLVSCLDREFMDEYKEEGFSNFLNNPELEWLNKSDIKNRYTLAQLYLIYRKDIVLIDFKDYRKIKQTND